MIQVSTSAKARVAADIINQLAKVIGHGKAGFWMLTANPAFILEDVETGEIFQGSPVMALKAGMEQEVRAAAAALIAEKKAKVA
jgi:hypothetical protein